jgi:hypothetical protein
VGTGEERPFLPPGFSDFPSLNQSEAHHIMQIYRRPVLMTRQNRAHHSPPFLVPYLD